MSEDQTEGAIPEPAMTPEQLYAINMEAIASRERVELEAIRARTDSNSEQRRTIALSFALQSFGLGQQSFNPPLQKPPGDEILSRAGSFDAFLRGETRETPTPLHVVDGSA